MTGQFRVGSLFDGSGGFPLAAALCGGYPVWASEVEPYPIAVTHSGFPSMKHLGDVTKINGAEIEPVDVITFGSPCQDMSVAGKREGIKHSAQGDEETTRSGLFYEAVRIIKEMRKATNGKYPRYAVWENVPGAFSSNKGWDFHAVLEALCSVCDNTVSIPKPADRRKPTKLVWLGAGEIVGDKYSVCWRTFDAQYWGVPQRRKRVYLVADFNSQRAREVLFKPDSLRGDMSQGNEAKQGAPADAVGGSDGGYGVECLNPWDCQSKRIFSPAGAYPTLQSKAEGSGTNNQAVLLDGSKVARTLTARYDGSPCTDRGQNIIVCSAFMAGQGANQVPSALISLHLTQDPISTTDFTPCISSGNSEHGQASIGVCIPAPVIALQANGIDRADTAGCNGAGWRENEMYTLNTIDRHAVCFAIENHPAGNRVNLVFDGICQTLTSRMGTGGGNTPMVLQDTYQEKSGPLMANSHPGSYTGQDAFSDMLVAGKSPKPPRRYIIRRLMPVECTRLQGFPDWWGEIVPYDPADAEFWESVRKTYAEINGKKYRPVKDLKKWYDKLHTDGAEYKMWGNGIALPCALYVFQGIAEIFELEMTS